MQNIDVWMFKVQSSNSGEKKKKKSALKCSLSVLLIIQIWWQLPSTRLESGILPEIECLLTGEGQKCCAHESHCESKYNCWKESLLCLNTIETGKWLFFFFLNEFSVSGEWINCWEWMFLPEFIKRGWMSPDLALPLREQCLYNSANIAYKKFPKGATGLSWLQPTDSILLIQQCNGGHDKEMGMGNHILTVIKLCIVIATFWLV